MSTNILVSASLRQAGALLRVAFAARLEKLSRRRFVAVWSAVAYLFPGLHPDGYDGADSGWPRVLKRFAAEAWRRACAGELDDDELYPSDAQWSGVYDRLGEWETDEIVRRLEIAGSSLDA
jgi:hypothetical protein